MAVGYMRAFLLTITANPPLDACRHLAAPFSKGATLAQRAVGDCRSSSDWNA